MNGGERGGKVEKIIEAIKTLLTLLKHHFTFPKHLAEQDYGFFVLLQHFQVSPIILTHPEQKHNAPAFQQVEEERWLSPAHTVSPVATLT